MMKNRYLNRNFQIFDDFLTKNAIFREKIDENYEFLAQNVVFREKQLDISVWLEKYINKQLH